MSEYLLDTNLISELSKPKPNHKVESWILELDELCISGMTLLELRYGLLQVKSSYKEKWFKRIYPSLYILDSWPEMFLDAADMLEHSKKKGVSVNPADSVIAAFARRYNRVLVTRNVRDFAACGIALLNPF